ncbi:MAG: DUF1343 domain-containing protein [Melioribacteraceae bacterium]|nr:DUF1343 domain-containing protein [Melioribacteraceae bacterium]MCF8355451.1 DUF1343 domain-containing protein [Melioribacteraceae bacterium]MCF8395386.1 DUF1343 domain-containing protein [Melioribacteraceae bacterium]MCF8420479.1 DUF1343 domain-containing protein [Melioribacteraceae bacterium]
MRYIKYLTALFSFIFFMSCNAQKSEQAVTTVNANPGKLSLGSEILMADSLHIISNKNIAIVTNLSAVLSDGTHIIDTLLKKDEIKLMKIFSPEHGFKGKFSAGADVKDSQYKDTGIPIISLYGDKKAPDKNDLEDIELILFDIQDIGARFYTYISTLYNVVQSCAVNKIELVVLDRPNPLGGKKVEGPILKADQKSFVGIAEIPVIHGMTTGELSLMFADFIFSEKSQKADIKVIKMKDWNREFTIYDYYIPWIKPSPNIKSKETIFIYPATCFLEGTNISEGRGTDDPFLVIGAPFINSDQLINSLQKNNRTDVRFSPITFTPVSIPGVSEFPKYRQKKCNGIKIEIIDHNTFSQIKFAVNLLIELQKLYPAEFEMNEWIDKLFGDVKIREMILNNSGPDEIISSWQTELNEFLELRNEYLLYD